MNDEASIRTRLREAGVQGEIRVLNEDAPTAALTAFQLGCDVAAIVNSLIFTADGAPILILASGANRVDRERVRKALNATKIKRATPEMVAQATGQVVGGVGPLGHPAPLPTLIDLSLASIEPLWVGAGLPHMVFQTTFTELQCLTNAIPAAIQVLP